MKISLFILFCVFTFSTLLNSVLGADTPLQLSVDGRREKIDSCSSSACSPFTKCRTWLAPQASQSYPDSLVYYYPVGVNSPIGLSSAIVTTATGSGTSSILFGDEYYQPWPGQISSTSGLTWKGNYVSQVVAGQPFIIGALGHKNFAIVTYDNNGNLVIPVCNYFTFSVTFEITNLRDTSQNFFHSLSLNLTAEETPNDGCNYLYDKSTIGSYSAANPWYGAATSADGQGRCPYGPDCTTTCKRSIEEPIMRARGSSTRSTTSTTSTTTTTTCNSCTCGAGCNDRITIPQTGLTDGFTFKIGSNTYFLSLLGFTTSTTYSAGTPVQEFVTKEGQSNIAYLWAKIDQACSSSNDCSDGVSCSTGTCVDHTNANLNPNNFPFDFCTFTYDDARCKPNGDGCATGTCGPSGCTTLVSNSFCASKFNLSPNAVCKKATCDPTATNTYNCALQDIAGGCDGFSQANGLCNTVCNSDGTCACAPTTTTTTTTTTTPKPTTTTTTTTTTTSTTTTTTTTPPTTTTTTALPGTTAPGTTTTTTAPPTTTTTTTTPTTTTTTTTPTTTTTTTTPPCTDPCALCNLPSDFQADCSKCPYRSGFKNICVYNNGGGWNLVQDVPNDQVYLFFDTPLKRQQNYFPGDTHLDLDWKTQVPSTCDCNYVTTTTSTTTPAPRSPLIIPTVFCTQCFANTGKCFATIGYDARNVWADPSTPDSPIVTRYQGTNNFFTKNSDSTPFQLNQPEQFLRDLVNNAAIIEFDEGDKLTWHLDGNTVDISSKGSLNCDKCEVPALITVTPVSSDTSIGAVYDIDFSHRSDFCSSNSPSLTHFIIDVPLCRTVGFSVDPPQCLRNDGTAAAPGYISNRGWDTSAVNPDCFFLSLDPFFFSPFSVPLFDTPSCQQITISLSIDTTICPNIDFGTTPVSALYDDICPNCQTCKSSSLFGIASSCPLVTCQPGQKFKTDTCVCETCTPSTLNCPPFWFANLNSCECRKCPATCPDGQYLDATLCCQPCPNGVCCTDTPSICPPGFIPDGKICACSECPIPDCQDGTELDATRCGCVECLPDGCPSGYIQSKCECIPLTVDTPATTPPGCPPENIDACGVCNGDGTMCAGCDGKPGTGRWVDACRVECGDGSTCPGCLHDNCNVCTLPVDICGVCGGNGSSCLGCDGLPPTLTRPATQYDWCGICGGNGTSCLGCGGVPFAGPCPSGITPGAAAAVASLSALAALSALALAAVLLRLRKRPELLYQAWDDTLRDYITEIESNPLYSNAEQEFNPLFHTGSI